MAVTAWAGPITVTTPAAAPTGLEHYIRAAGAWVPAETRVKTPGGWVLGTRPAVSGPALVPELPWDMPSRATMAATGKDVIAYFHTFPIYPATSGSTNYGDWLTPASQPSTGGKWRQRPYPFIEGTTTNASRIAYAKQDITTAANIGIDAFSFNILYGMFTTEAYRWTEHVLPYYDAAAEFSTENTPGFKICPDISMLQVKNNAGDPLVYADNLYPLLTHAAAYKRGGRPVVMLYNVDDAAQQWYIDFSNRLLAKSPSVDVVMIPSHQSTSTTALANYPTLFGNGKFSHVHQWNTPLYQTTPANSYKTFRDWAATNGVGFCGSAGPRWENDRPELDIPKQIEGFGVKVMQNSWESSIIAGDPMFKIVSWNDHLESHNIRPSTGYQFVPYDITAYYLAWFKSGQANPPTITRDAVFYHHRMHLGGATYSTSLQTAGAYDVTNGPPVDRVITTVFLTAPADVIVTTGGVARTHAAVPAGVSTLDDPMFADDTATFRVVRGGVDVVPTFSSAFPTRSTITYQDLLYRMGSSTRAPMVGVQSDLPQDR